MSKDFLSSIIYSAPSDPEETENEINDESDVTSEMEDNI